MLSIRPTSLKDANAFVALNHRHNRPVVGHKWSIACFDGDRLCGVAICGRPIGRYLDDGETIEALRVCTDGTRNACSCLYGACARAAKELGYKRIITYILESETGASVKASGWELVATDVGGVSWNSKSRPREDSELTLFGEIQKQPPCKKSRWEKKLRD